MTNTGYAATMPASQLRELLNNAGSAEEVAAAQFEFCKAVLRAIADGAPDPAGLAAGMLAACEPDH